MLNICPLGSTGEDGEEHRNEEGRKSISFHLGEGELRQRREMAESPALLPSKFCFNALWREAATEGGAEEVRVGRPGALLTTTSDALFSILDP